MKVGFPFLWLKCGLPKHQLLNKIKLAKETSANASCKEELWLGVLTNTTTTRAQPVKRAKVQRSSTHVTSE